MNKNFIKVTLLMASMLTMLANAIISPSLPFITDAFSDVPHAEFLTKLMMTLPSLSVAVMSPFAGTIVDKIGRVKVLIIALIFYIIAGSSGFWLNNLYLILVGRIFLGFGIAGILTATVTLIGDYFVDDERQRFLSIQGTFMALGGLIFITIAGYITGIDWRLPFLLYAIGFVALVLTIKYLPEPKKEEMLLQQQEKGKSSRTIWFIFLSGFLGTLFFYIIPVQLPYYLKSLDGVSSGQIGLSIGLLTLTQAFSAYFYKNLKEKLGYYIIYALSFAVMGIGYFGIGVSENYLQIVICVMFLGVGVGWLFPNANLWLINSISAAKRGKYVGLLNSFTFLGMFMSPILIQPIQQQFEIKGSFTVVGFALLMISICYFFISKISISKKE